MTLETATVHHPTLGKAVINVADLVAWTSNGWSQKPAEGPQEAAGTAGAPEATQEEAGAPEAAQEAQEARRGAGKGRKAGKGAQPAP